MDNYATSEMVTDAIETLQERGGSSLQNIKKYISAIYQVDIQRRAPFIRKYLRTAVDEGDLVQTRGRGAAGSFKLAARGARDTFHSRKQKRAAPKRAAPSSKSTPPATNVPGTIPQTAQDATSARRSRAKKRAKPAKKTGPRRKQGKSRKN